MVNRLTHIDFDGYYVYDQSIAFDEKRRGKEIDRLAEYEETGFEPEEIEQAMNDCAETVAKNQWAIKLLQEMEEFNNSNFNNHPLTLDEFRKMEGEPVWIKGAEAEYDEWKILNYFGPTLAFFIGERDGYLIETYGKDWFAYRKKPKD